MRRLTLFMLGILLALGAALSVTWMVSLPEGERLRPPAVDLAPAIAWVEEPTELFAHHLHDCSRGIVAGHGAGGVEGSLLACLAGAQTEGRLPSRPGSEQPAAAALGLLRHGWQESSTAPAAALGELLAHFAGVEDLRLMITASTVDDDGDTLEGEISIELVGRDGDGRREWLRGRAEISAERAPDGAWRVTRLAADGLQSLVAPVDIFVEVAGSAGLAATDPPVLEHPTLGLAAYGAATADVDGDGLLDLLSTGRDGNWLYRSNGDGTFTDIADAARVKALPHPATAALFSDLDGDGDPDLFLSADGTPFVFENRRVPDGETVFRDVTAAAGVQRGGACFSIAAADIEGDGDVDIYLACYGNYGPVMPESWESGRNGQPNLLFVNQGDLTFREEAAARGADDPRWSYAAAFADVDGDGDPDLYVANDFGGGNSLLINDGGRFTDEALERGVADNGYSMGVSFGDIDADGDLDLHVTKMSAAAGRRILSRLDPADFPGRERLGALSAGNALYLNLGDGLFRDVTARAGPFEAGWAWGGGFVDIDGDGLPDLHTPNGFLSGERMYDTRSLFWRQVVDSEQQTTADGRQESLRGFIAEQGGVMRQGYGFSGYERNLVALNRGDGTFLDISGVTGADSVSDGRGAVYADLDNDGDSDIFLRAMHGRAHFLFVNRVGQDAGFIRVALEGRASGRDAWGAVVRAGLADGRVLTRLKAGGDGFVSQSDPRLLFGLGGAPGVEWLEVAWPGGRTDRYPGVPAGTSLRIVEGAEQPGVVSEPTFSFARAATGSGGR